MGALDSCDALLIGFGRSRELEALGIGAGDGLGCICRFIVVVVVGKSCPEWIIARRRSVGGALND